MSLMRKKTFYSEKIRKTIHLLVVPIVAFTVSACHHTKGTQINDAKNGKTVKVSEVVNELRCSLAGFAHKKEAEWKFQPDKADLEITFDNIIVKSPTGTVGIEIPVSPFTIGGTRSRNLEKTTGQKLTFGFSSDLEVKSKTETVMCQKLRKEKKDSIFPLEKALLAFARDLDSIPAGDPNFLTKTLVVESGFKVVKTDDDTFSLNFFIFEASKNLKIISTNENKVKVTFTLKEEIFIN